MKIYAFIEKLMIRLMVFKVRLRMLFVVLVVLCMLGILLGYHGQTDVRYCFRYSQMPSYHAGEISSDNIGGNNQLQPLEDVLLAKFQPISGRSIFFHETSCHRSQHSGMDAIFGSLSTQTTPTTPAHLLQLTARQACAVESAALHNTNLSVFVLFASPVYYENNNISVSNVINAVLSYPNVHMRNLNLWSYAEKTPISDWLNSGDLFKSRYVLSHISDFLRYLTLWRFGGTYLDMDVIMLRTIEELPPNYTGAESDSYLAAGVMNFAPDGFGHEVAQQCLNDFQRNFDGGDWGNNGPGVITRIMQKICATDVISHMFESKRCKNFKVFERDAFYAIPWEEWEHFFEAQYLEDTINRTKKSYVIHVWNKHSKQRRVKVGSKAAYGKFASHHCPKVYAHAGEFF